MVRTWSSLSPVTSTITSSAARSTVSPRGTTTRSPRRMATTVESRGRPSSMISLSLAGEVSARRTSARRALPPSKESSRTNDPTLTASWTSAVMRCGVDTATSTPHISLNIHSFLGLLTRATTRGTPNSCLASSAVTRLSSSSPVTAATTSASVQPAAASAATSQASAWNQRAPWGSPLRSACRTTAALLSMMVTSWSPLTSCSAMKRPTLPPPAITTFIHASFCRVGRDQWPLGRVARRASRSASAASPTAR